MAYASYLLIFKKSKIIDWELNTELEEKVSKETGKLNDKKYININPQKWLKYYTNIGMLLSHTLAYSFIQFRQVDITHRKSYN